MRYQGCGRDKISSQFVYVKSYLTFTSCTLKTKQYGKLYFWDENVHPPFLLLVFCILIPIIITTMTCFVHLDSGTNGLHDDAVDSNNNNNNNSDNNIISARQNEGERG